jgi:predicted nuclease of predicted toxin-antitoxin system
VRVVTDENMSSQRLAARLRTAGHDVVLAGEVGLLSVSDARVLTWAVGQGRPVLTRDHEDFADLHDLIMATGGHHPGILVVRFDNDPRHNLTERGIATALGNLGSSGVTVADQLHVLNHWR